MRLLCCLLLLLTGTVLATDLAPAKFSTSLVKPWGYKSSELHEQGLLVQFTRALASEAELPFNNVMRPYPRVIKEIKSGTADFAVMFASPKAEQIAVDLGQVVTIKVVAVANAGEPVIDDISKLKGKRVGVIRGAAYGPDIDDNPDIERISFNDTAQGIQMLLLERIDVMVASNYSINHALQELYLEPERITPIYHLATRYGNLYWSRASNQMEQAKRLQQALSRLRELGVLDNIFAIDAALAKQH
ncbi:ABC transporter substrate-binding protein [Agarivorans sp. Alg241-V36]|uniref:substrate-binding periplasmic protein n=1 Tax=Agarivorans sp. Alg241-V36 TaxID=2305992 RepID=UPI0013D6B260|nr:transporter substrate-binding domain-containing protein [Agarivorans sp. Alg241-V36]